MILNILKFPDPRLKETSEPVCQFDRSLWELLDGMAETMYQAKGIGLAAPQVGRLLRAFVLDLSSVDQSPRILYEFINPSLSGGEGKIVYEEGCLSIPGFSEEVERNKLITIDYQDRKGQPKRLTAEDLLAVAIQHEFDHLNGILFVDRLSPLKRRFVKKQLAKAITM